MSDVSDSDPISGGRRRAVSDFSEDTTGFGQVELRTAWHLIVRPRQVLDDYLTLGPTGGGRYTRPLRFYLMLCGVLMVMLFLTGGAQQMLTGFPSETLGLLAERGGKSPELFLAHLDNWISLILVPIMSVFYALSIAPFLKWWDRAMTWSQAFRATFTFLNAWTILLLPFGFLAYGQSSLTVIVAVLILVLLITTFVRMGRGRWWRTWLGAVLKTIVLSLSVSIGAGIGIYPVIGIALACATLVG